MRYWLLPAGLLASSLHAQVLEPTPPSIFLEPWVDTQMFQAVDIVHAGDDRLFIAKRNGAIRIVSDSGVVDTVPFLHLSGTVNTGGSEQGLLGLAFDPDYANNGQFYVSYTGYPSPGNTNIVRYSVSADPDVADAGSAHPIFFHPQPYTNHNGGDIDFGPDGHLYIPLGDGGNAGDPQGNAQDLSDPLGDILRIHIEPDSTYSIPSDNPHANAGGDTLPEIWASGLRNPWRFGFDRLTGDLWLGDVGQASWEEVDRWPANTPGGANFGWRCREGFDPYNTTNCGPASSYVDPIIAHPNTPWCSIIGGRVYRGARFPRLQGTYIYTDYCVGSFHGLRQDGNGGWSDDTLLVSGLTGFTAIGEDAAGELFAVNKDLGVLYMVKDPCPYAPPSIAYSGAELVTDPGSEHQWYRDGQPIAGATGPTWTPAQSGYYSVVVRMDSACALASDSLLFLPTGTLEDGGAGWTVAPDPAHGRVTVVAPEGFRGTVLVHDALGRTLGRWPMTGDRLEFQWQGLPAGLRWLQAVDEQGVVRMSRAVLME
ncbi:MAG: PQQ-dependent sugar dehydrogenase [Flavobacteriales bacterium]|nr:PQQ-dependent sugar dehydrogenase [Flavobacteriales bacterium]